MKASRDFRQPGALFSLAVTISRERFFLPDSNAINEEIIRIEIFSCFNRNFKVIGEEIIRTEVFFLVLTVTQSAVVLCEELKSLSG